MSEYVYEPTFEVGEEVPLADIFPGDSRVWAVPFVDPLAGDLTVAQIVPCKICYLRLDGDESIRAGVTPLVQLEARVVEKGKVLLGALSMLLYFPADQRIHEVVRYDTNMTVSLRTFPL
ncbi:MAG: hypothetical protein PHS44_01150 [Candidatus Dojkabacteria bacterium]|nr:hypothetical protein [Candidatus Dojkabacteria bacterium]